MVDLADLCCIAVIILGIYLDCSDLRITDTLGLYPMPFQRDQVLLAALRILYLDSLR